MRALTRSKIKSHKTLENFSGHMFIGLIVELNGDTKELDHQPVMGWTAAFVV